MLLLQMIPVAPQLLAVAFHSLACWAMLDYLLDTFGPPPGQWPPRDGSPA